MQETEVCVLSDACKWGFYINNNHIFLTFLYALNKWFILFLSQALTTSCGHTDIVVKENSKNIFQEIWQSLSLNLRWLKGYIMQCCLIERCSAWLDYFLLGR